MNHQYYNVIGVMSGTSLDAIDLVYVKLVRESKWSFQIKAFNSVDYSQQWKEKLASGIDLCESDLQQLDIEYTDYLASLIKQFINQNKIQNLLAISSHGHTIKHEPEVGITLQIGNLPQLAVLLDTRVICDFRVQDVVLNGQGAPLVPIGDELLFSEYDYCLNLGGFANISFKQNDTRFAYDIAPVNVVLNQFANLLGAEYDDKGSFAKAGLVHQNVLNKLNDLNYYDFNFPKSLGIEWVKNNIWSLMEEVKNPIDGLATFTEHAAYQISNAITSNSNVLITGGGAYNRHLVDRIGYHSKANLIIPPKDLIEFKEALIFALLGVLRLRNENNCLSSVTGAIKDHSSGEIYLP